MIVLLHTGPAGNCLYCLKRKLTTPRRRPDSPQLSSPNRLTPSTPIWSRRQAVRPSSDSSQTLLRAPGVLSKSLLFSRLWVHQKEPGYLELVNAHLVSRLNLLQTQNEAFLFVVFSHNFHLVNHVAVSSRRDWAVLTVPTFSWPVGHRHIGWGWRKFRDVATVQAN